MPNGLAKKKALETSVKKELAASVKAKVRAVSAHRPASEASLAL